MRVFLTSILLFIATSLYATSPSRESHGMVVSENNIASTIGANILASGGNAIDAAVAVGYALAVLNPCCGNIGGGGFMTIHLADGKNIFLNFREKAPLKASPTMFLDKHGDVMADLTTKGYLAVGVPGTVLGLDTALQHYGTLSRKIVMAPAIQLAEQGFLVTPYEANQFNQFTHDFREDPNVAAIFLNHGEPYKPNERLIQKDLASTLRLIAEKGPAVFYKGSIAEAIVKASDEKHGILTLADFANYTVEESSPIICTYRQYTILSAPPPSSGGITLCEILNILENFSFSSIMYPSSEDIRYIIEAMGYGFRDRNTFLGDPGFVSNPIDKLLAKSYAKKLSEQIKRSRFNSVKVSSPLHELTDTTHYSIVDGKGNAVAVTYTLNGFFGARVIADHTGFFLNDEMDDFATKTGTANKFGLVQQDANNIQPGKRPLSSMTPTIVLKDNHLFMVIGSPGGPRIITSVLLSMLNIIDAHMNLQQAIDAPRFHYQNEPDVIDVEPLALSYAATQILHYKGYRFNPQVKWGAIEAIMVTPNGKLIGANDRRRPDGAAIGY